MDIEISCLDKSYNFEYKFDGARFDHTLTVPDDCNPTDDALFRIAILSRPKNSEVIRICGVRPYRNAVEHFEKYNRCRIKVAVEKKDEITKVINDLSDTPISLSFSGGFDSIASLALLGGSAKLISNDFGGAFERESRFFSQFQTSIFRWDLRGNRPRQDMKFPESVDWRFMLAPSLCYRNIGEPYVIATGTIMEASPFWYRGTDWPEFSSYSDFGFGPGIAVVNPVSCLSEYATTKIAVQYLDETMLNSSLESLAATGSLKKFRKEVLVALVKGDSIPSATECMPRHRFGAGFAGDLLALYLVWKLGYTWVVENYCANISPYAKFLDMSFFEKVNTYNLGRFDQTHQNILGETLRSYGLDFYSQYDGDRLENSLSFRNHLCSK